VTNQDAGGANIVISYTPLNAGDVETPEPSSLLLAGAAMVGRRALLSPQTSISSKLQP
jgi:hypothetical protein